ncbi:MAG: hypothetical protein KAG28_01210, partial [Cocleimonas sp.]|nr:hypothetical protein [Cocleimonas sp.]
MIKKYKWSQSVATGNPAIDLQHKQFFFALSDFAEELEQGNAAKSLKKVLVFLKYYGEWHFGKEEDTISVCTTCPLACENKEAHQYYILTIDTLLAQIRSSGTSEALAHTAYEKLTYWLVNHIMRIDKKNAEHIIVKSPNKKP